MYSYIGKNFVLTMLKLGAEREELKVVNDQVGAPTYAPDLAQASLAALEKLQPSLSGIYNCASGGECSWFQFAQEIFNQARACGFELKLQRLLGISSVEYPTPASRPLNSRLNQSLLQETFGIEVPHWKLGLEHCFGHISQNKGVSK